MSKAELSVSNISWPNGHDDVAYRTLAEQGVRKIDIAPTKALTSVHKGAIDPAEVAVFNAHVRSFGIEVAGIQSLAFGRTENIFHSDKESLADFQKHLSRILVLAEQVGARTVIFGAGNTRTVGDLSDTEIRAKATDFFGELDAQVGVSGVTIGIEPVSTTYTNGAEAFGTESTEIVDFVEGFENTRYVFDSFAVQDSGENPLLLLNRATNTRALAAHAQIAEPALSPHNLESPLDHDLFDEAFSRQLKVFNRPAVMAIEMLQPAISEDVTAEVLTTAIDSARTFYRRSL